MRRPFLVITILGAIAAAVLGILRREPLYFAQMGAGDLVDGRFPEQYLAASIDEVNLAPAVSRLRGRAAGDRQPSEALALVEMQAAGVLSAYPDPNIISLAYQELLEQYPQSPLIHYRYGAWLLTRLQCVAAEKRRASIASPVREPGGARKPVGEDLEAVDLARRARMELFAAAQADQHNSLPLYEIAYSYIAFGDTDEATGWLERAVDAPEFDAGDDVVIAGCAKAVTRCKAPPLEGLISTYRVARYAPSYLAGRMETLVSGLLSDKVRAEYVGSEYDYLDYLVGFEDLTVKLFESAEVLRQSQASLVTAGILWRKVAAEAASKGDERLRAAARSRLAEASYRYLLVGWRRAAAGLPPQQGIVDLDIPLDLRLPFSKWAGRIAGALFVLVVVLVLPALVLGVAAIRVKALRQLALSLATLAVFAALGYSASFYSTFRERQTTATGLEKRLRLLCETPEILRAEGEPQGPADFRSDVAKTMLPITNYTLQAGRVLAYIGTRDCYEELIDALTDPNVGRPSEVISILREETGQDFGYSRAASREVRDEAIRAWRTWWHSKRDSFPEAPTCPAVTARGE
ncbi:MAG: hypothetical protein J7M19_00920 [Planctomycetes bacterium]|nr:hypothetical protein [Planctomycetota bacterium]